MRHNNSSTENLLRKIRSMVYEEFESVCFCNILLPSGKSSDRLCLFVYSI